MSLKNMKIESSQNLKTMVKNESLENDGNIAENDGNGVVEGRENKSSDVSLDETPKIKFTAAPSLNDADVGGVNLADDIFADGDVQIRHSRTETVAADEVDTSPIVLPFNSTDDPDSILATASDYSKKVNNNVNDAKSEIVKFPEPDVDDEYAVNAHNAVPPTDTKTPKHSDLNINVGVGAVAVSQSSTPVPFVPKIKKKQSAKKRNKIFIANINSNIGDNQLKTKFAKFGAVISSKIIKDPVTNASKGMLCSQCIVSKYRFDVA